MLPMVTCAMAPDGGIDPDGHVIRFFAMKMVQACWSLVWFCG
ncbi:MAG TPA: hypothetical protein DEB17_03865 [Chlorobaculum sp.]|uniref:Uncharacterized protein n=1 Tax=Chlorobaculum tepidum (strain ATCC 49652 / DSM 12025 / NBRC 103806 / TLS) TaxID=194439 RepID=Q8KDX9_CHLTE|nr:hypothetical protein CT0915 [Chlorobaculum tepidum TLS]HBU23122.1 hypothetical protein [Chlorobaculum sp.]